jgi:hypothetical protein
MDATWQKIEARKRGYMTQKNKSLFASITKTTAMIIGPPIYAAILFIATGFAFTDPIFKAEGIKPAVLAIASILTAGICGTGILAVIIVLTLAILALIPDIKKRDVNESD